MTPRRRARRLPAATLLLLAAAALAGCGGGGGSSPTEGSTPPAPSPPTGPPNLVLIFVDDLGWGDLSSYGHPLIRTPNIDSLAAEGARLSSFSTPVSVCAPSRAAVLTGRYPIRVGVPWNPPERLNDGELTIADLVRQAGYTTAMIGKWHLGWVPEDMPIHHGFDTFYGRIRFQGEMIEGDQTTDGVPLDLLTRVYTERAVQIIHESRDRPFFLYLAYNAPHSPYLPSDTFAGTSPAGVYGDVVEELDWGVGEVLQALRDTGVEENTLVLFTSDNGPEFPPGSAGPFWGGKGWPSEGGVRVPALVRWPARIPRGVVIDEITSTLDVLPTFVAAARAALPRDRSYDGVDLGPLLAGDVDRLYGNGIDQGRELLYWENQSAAAIRSGRWKYLQPGFWRSEPGLYDLETDPGERQNLLSAEPEIAQRLRNRMDEIIRAW